MELQTPPRKQPAQGDSPEQPLLCSPQARSPVESARGDLLPEAQVEVASPGVKYGSAPASNASAERFRAKKFRDPFSKMDFSEVHEVNSKHADWRAVFMEPNGDAFKLREAAEVVRILKAGNRSFSFHDIMVYRILACNADCYHSFFDDRRFVVFEEPNGSTSGGGLLETRFAPDCDGGRPQQVYLSQDIRIMFEGGTEGTLDLTKFTFGSTSDRQLGHSGHADGLVMRRVKGDLWVVIGVLEHKMDRTFNVSAFPQIRVYVGTCLLYVRALADWNNDKWQDENVRKYAETLPVLLSSPTEFGYFPNAGTEAMFDQVRKRFGYFLDSIVRRSGFLSPDLFLSAPDGHLFPMPFVLERLATEDPDDNNPGIALRSPEVFQSGPRNYCLSAFDGDGQRWIIKIADDSVGELDQDLNHSGFQIISPTNERRLGWGGYHCGVMSYVGKSLTRRQVKEACCNVDSCLRLAGGLLQLCMSDLRHNDIRHNNICYDPSGDVYSLIDWEFSDCKGAQASLRKDGRLMVLPVRGEPVPAPYLTRPAYANDCERGRGTDMYQIGVMIAAALRDVASPFVFVDLLDDGDATLGSFPAALDSRVSNALAEACIETSGNDMPDPLQDFFRELITSLVSSTCWKDDLGDDEQLLATATDLFKQLQGIHWSICLE